MYQVCVQTVERMCSYQCNSLRHVHFGKSSNLELIDDEASNQFLFLRVSLTFVRGALVNVRASPM